MANRIDKNFSELRAAGKSGFIAYIAAGDPTLEATEKLVPALEASGVDILELGVPFSDPLADGVVNQMAAQRALDAGATIAKLFESIRRIRAKTEIPLVLFTLSLIHI